MSLVYCAHMKNILRESGALFVLLGAIIGAPLAAQATTVSVTGLSPTGAVAASSTVSFEVSETGLVDPTYSVSDSYSGQGATTGTIDKAGYFTWTPGVYDGGWHTLAVSATDVTGAVATTTVRILVAATHVFAQDISPSATIAAGRAFTFTAYAPGFNSPSFSVYDRTSGSSITESDMNVSTGAFSWTPTKDDLGAHTLVVAASDVDGHSAQTLVPVSVITPTVSVTSYKPSVVAGSLALFTAVATGLTDPTWSVVDYPSGTATTTSVVVGDVSSAGVFSWIPQTSDVGVHAINLMATDAYGNVASTTVTLFVTPAAANPLVSAAASTSASAPPVAATSTETSASPNANDTSTATASADVGTYQFNAYLGVGSQGAGVTALQQLLTRDDVYSGPVTGYFGTLTEAAVAALQGAHGLKQVGYVGPMTRVLLNQEESSAALVAASTTSVSSGSNLTASQVSSIITLLEAFGADAATIAQVQAALGQ